MLKRRLKIQLVLMLSLFVFAHISWAQNNEKVSLAEATKIVREQTNGKILSARMTNFHGQKTHRIQVLTPQGRVKVYQIPINRERSNNFSQRPNARQQPRQFEPKDSRNQSNPDHRNHLPRQQRPTRSFRQPSQSTRNTIRPRNSRPAPRINSSRSQLKPSSSHDRGKQQR